MFGNELGEGGAIFSVAVVYVGVTAVTLWLATIAWTFRDMRARSRDSAAQLIVVLMVAALPLTGLLVYVFLRPRETLSEAYERSLEEEALLQEIEEKLSCPGCGQRVRAEWQVCPGCHTRLRKPCGVCRNLLELSWKLCPYCAADQRGYADVDTIENHSKMSISPEQRVSLTRRNSDSSLEFIESDEF